MAAALRGLGPNRYILWIGQRLWIAFTLRSKGLVSAKGLFLSNKIPTTSVMTVLLLLESLEFASFGLCSSPEFQRHHGYYGIILAVGFRNPQSEILTIFPHRLNLINTIDNWT